MATQDSQPHLRTLSPWTRNAAAEPNKSKDDEPEIESLPRQQQGHGHIANQRLRLRLRQYPKDCPALVPQWFHAIDSPKYRPNPAGDNGKEEKGFPPPKKFAAFSIRDSKRCEAAYQKLLDEGQHDPDAGDDLASQHTKLGDGAGNPCARHGPVVPVNEDYLFDVDIEDRELKPAYWRGPIYHVRRGTWFYQDGTSQRPCEENLSEQLEDGYIKVKPWRLPTTIQTSPSPPRGRPTSWPPNQDDDKGSNSASLSPKVSSPDMRNQVLQDAAAPPPQQTEANAAGQPERPQKTHRLFGSYMNSIVTFQDSTTAWMLTDDFLSRVNYSVYQRFAGGGHFAGIKLTRGYVSPVKVKQERTGKSNHVDTMPETSANTKEQPPRPVSESSETHGEQETSTEAQRDKLERHMSSLLGGSVTGNSGTVDQAEEDRKSAEREMKEDYREDGDQEREIDEVCFTVHGAGHRLGLRLESINFVHDVNTLRKTLKGAYAASPDLKALNAELGKDDGANSRIQVLPICWRHLLDFPKQSLRHARKEAAPNEKDLGDASDVEVDEVEFPTLEDISVDGVPAVRSLITDLALDILLYQSPAYKDHIARIVLEECNRIYHLFLERNPGWKGKVSFIGHSLGSAILFDILCRQSKPASHYVKSGKPLRLDFEVEDFYALGSPIGLFQMLRGKPIRGRNDPNFNQQASNPGADHDSRGTAASENATLGPRKKPREALDATASGLDCSIPACARVFNIFHPTDPIAYRLEPLISSKMAALKPQPLPYTKRGIFGAPMGQGLTGIGAKVSQSVSSMWSNVASSLITRSLGVQGTPIRDPLATLKTGHEASQVTASPAEAAGNASGMQAAPLSAATTEISKPSNSGKDAAMPNPSTQEGLSPRPADHAPTLLDDEIETLFSGFQQSRLSDDPRGLANPKWAEAEARAVRREEEKVRRLNTNGRVDYAIQEGVFDINMIAAIASHLAYWGDEDVCHFLLSQMLSRGKVQKSRKSQDTSKMPGEIRAAT